MKKGFFGVFFLLVSTLSVAQNTKPTPSLHIKKSTAPITIDGQLNEASWQNAEVATDFFQSFPADTSYTLTKTEVKVTYDEVFFYVGAVCYDELEGDYVIQSLKRDFSYPKSDAFAVYIDPFNDKTNGFSFAVNPLGVQREGLLENGGSFGVTTAWDQVWFAEVTQQQGKWVVEMAIPFKSIRYNEGIDHWRINFSRNDLKRNENGSWSGVPRNFNIGSLAFTGELLWDAPPKKPGSNVVLIPYLTGNTSHNYQTEEDPTDYGGNGGMDAKVAVSSSLNLDLTVNPDFSQVEVDRQVTNLSRFSLFFPERRNFFIENSDLFAQFGFRQIRPFFSRRIGLSGGNQIPILAGARLSGKLTQDWRIGLMNLQTEGDGELGVNPQNYSVAAFQRKVLARSNIAGIFVNRQGFRGSSPNYGDYNRVAGMDFNYASSNNKLRGKIFYHRAFGSGLENNNFAHAVWAMYNTQKMAVHWNHEYVGDNYDAEVGFVPRINNFNPETGETEQRSYWRFEPIFNYNFYPNSQVVNSHGPGIYLSEYTDEDYVTTERLLQFNYRVNFLSSSNVRAEVNQNRVMLFYDTDVTFSGNTPINAGTYDFINANLGYTSNQRKKFNYDVSADYGSYYTGTKITYGGRINYRAQPWGVFSVRFQQNEIQMPDSIGTAQLSLLGPNIGLSFTKSMFLTTFIQYNTQIENVNINSRLQWRFRPMSDLYVVYTDNYDSTILGVKNRAVVVKLVYWLNV